MATCLFTPEISSAARLNEVLRRDREVARYASRRLR
jgi:hypothetical protein